MGLMLLLSMLGALAIDETSELPQDNGQHNDITGDEVLQMTSAQHRGNEIDTRSCQPDMCVLLAEFGAIQSRLAAAERRVEELKSENRGETE